MSAENSKGNVLRGHDRKRIAAERQGMTTTRKAMIGNGNASGGHDRKRIATDGLGMEQYGAAKERIRPGRLGNATAMQGAKRKFGAKAWQRRCSVTRGGE